MKVAYDPTTRRLLGGQAVGGGQGVDKRLDVLATALAGGLTVDDLAHVDFAYAPPFSSARDVVNTAGFAAGNAAAGLLRPAGPALPTTGLVLDVRDPLPAQLHPVPAPHVLNVPLGELRGRVSEVLAAAAAPGLDGTVTAVWCVGGGGGRGW